MSALAAQQRQFARHLRDPGHAPAPPGIEARRLNIYAELVYNAIEGFVAGGFPVLRTLLDDADWHALVRRFVATHPCHTPYFLRIAEEFLAFLQQQEAELGLPPFARELAHYEWVELALDVAEEEPPAPVPESEVLERVLRLSPLAWPLAYAWPVHRISRDNQPATAPATPTCLVVYRDAGERVRFLELNPLSLRLLELLDAEPLSGHALLQALAAELGPAGEGIEEAGVQILARLAGLGVLGAL